MLFMPRDGELRVYKKNRDYVEIIFYNFDFTAPLNKKMFLDFSCRLADSNYTHRLHDFFVTNSKAVKYRVECIWNGAVDFGKSWEVVVKQNGVRIHEDNEWVYIYFRGWVAGHCEVRRIEAFTKGVNKGV